MRQIQVVTAYRPLPPESPAHERLGTFDWRWAMRLLAASIQASCGCPTLALTDEHAYVGGLPALRYACNHDRLMLWILEVSVAYLQSPAFSCDTVFVSPDDLVMGDLRPYFAEGADLGVLVRSHSKYRKRPILNAVQWWPLAARDRLVRFYAQALDVAKGLPDNVIRWGADSESLRVLLDPIIPGLRWRAGLNVHMHESYAVLQTVTTGMTMRVLSGRQPGTVAPVVDFKGARKHLMGQYADVMGVRP